MKKLWLLPLLGVLIVACKQRDKNMTSTIKSNPVTDSLTMKLDSIATNGDAIGFSVAVMNLDGVIYNNGFGYADVAANKEYTSETIQNIGSISKTFIGISLLKAQELGKLKLDDPVNDYLPFKVVNKKHPETPITIRQLATHTSSILDSDYYGLSYVLIDKTHDSNEYIFDYFNPSKTKTSIEVYLEKVVGENGDWNEDSFADYAPGTLYEYSNIAATLAALIIEKATDAPFNEFTKSHILAPLNMNASGWFDTEINSENRSRSFINKDTIIAKYELITYPDGGFITSSKDLSIYLIELMKGKAGKGTLLSPESYKEIFTNQLISSQITEDFDEDNSGIFMEFSNRGVGHNGGDPGIVAFMYFNPETNIGKIAIQNTDYDNNRQVILDFIEVWKILGSYENKI